MIYEVDLGLKHVKIKDEHIEKVPDSAHHLISLPGESFEDDQGMRGPGGVLIVCDDQVIFKKPGQPGIACKVPQRYDWPSDKGLMISTSQAFFNQGTCIVFMMSEVGDLYRVFIDHEGDTITNMKVSYFDTFSASIGMKILLSQGYLFSTGDCCNHTLYRFTGLGEDEQLPSMNSASKELIKFCP